MRIEVKVRTGKKISKVIESETGVFEVWLNAKPIKGKANRELIAVLAEHFRVNKNQLRILRGFNVPTKILQLTR